MFSPVARLDWQANTKLVHPSHVEATLPASPFQCTILRHFNHPFETYELELPITTDIPRLRAAWLVLMQKRSTLRTTFAPVGADNTRSFLALVCKSDCVTQIVWHGLGSPEPDCREPAAGPDLAYSIEVTSQPDGGYLFRLSLHRGLFDSTGAKSILKDLHNLYHRGIADSLPYTFSPTIGTPGTSPVVERAVFAGPQHWRKLVVTAAQSTWPSLVSSAHNEGAIETAIRFLPSITDRKTPLSPLVARAALAVTLSLHSGTAQHLICDHCPYGHGLSSRVETGAEIITVTCGPTTSVQVLLEDAKGDGESGVMTPLTFLEFMEVVEASPTSVRAHLTMYSESSWPLDADIPGWHHMSINATSYAGITVDIVPYNSNVTQVRMQTCSVVPQSIDLAAFADHFVTATALLSIPPTSNDSPDMVHEIFRRLGDADKRHTLRYGLGRPEVHHPLAHELFSARATENPSAIALEFELTETMSYHDLEAHSNSLARELHEKGVVANVIVPVIFDVSCEMIVALLAILKAGGAYVPLAPDNPLARLEKVLQIVDAKIILHGQGTAIEARLSEIKDSFPELDLLEYRIGKTPVVACCPIQNLPVVRGEHLAHVLFTSGSTGIPKGVGIEHRNLSAFLGSSRGNAATSPGMRKLLVSPYTFDISTGDIYSTLTSGGTLGLVRRERLLSNLPYWLDAMKSTHVAITPSMARQLPTDGLPHLHHVIFVGETVPVHLAERLSRTRQLYNTMGPTECVIDATEYIIPRRSHFAQRVPVGYPTGSTKIYIVRPLTCELVARGEQGEICIGGPQVSRGYLSDTALSSTKFVADPFSAEPHARMFRSGDMGVWNCYGQLEHLGRLDGQVKFRGFRIETGEIENVLLSSAPIIAATYVDVLIVRNEQVLVAVLEIPEQNDNNSQPTELDLVTLGAVSKTCAKLLPPYMIPSVFLAMSKFPTNTHGKQDRAKISKTAHDYVVKANQMTASKLTGAREAHTEAEAAIISIAADLLDIPSSMVVLDATFVSQGGNSLQAMMLSSSLQSHGVGASVTDCLSGNSTLAMVAALPHIGSFGGSLGLDEQSTKREPYSSFLLAPDNWQDAALGAGLQLDDIEDVYPCTTTVQDWLELAFNNEGRAMITEFHYDMGANIDSDRFVWAWEQLRLREPALRTVFIKVNPKIAIQTTSSSMTAVVLKASAPCRGAGIEVLSVADDTKLSSLIDNLLRQCRVDFGTVPIQSWLIFIENEKKWRLVLSRHHALHDAATLDMHADELSQLYFDGEAAFSVIQARRTSETSFGAYMLSISNSEHQPEHREFWSHYLQGMGPAVWPSPSNVALTFCKDLMSYGVHLAVWPGSFQDLAKSVGVTKGAIIRGAFALAVSENERGSETLVYEIVDGRSGTGLNPWGFCAHFSPTRINTYKSMASEVDRCLAVVQHANRSFGEVLPHVGAAWDMAVNILGPKVESGQSIITSTLNILDLTDYRFRKDMKRDNEPIERLPNQLFNQTLLHSMFVGVYLPLYVEARILRDKVILACPYDTTVVSKEDMEKFVARQISVFESLEKISCT
ncbi:acetyl-CoA synthetase-like protein [Hymenopellis radicata]|nr:acetyl-CoA synthetase-like protein [Hymenopellis radicata]